MIFALKLRISRWLMLHVVRLHPSDVIVVECGETPTDQARRMYDTVQATWPNHRVLVLTDGVRLNVVEGEDDAA